MFTKDQILGFVRHALTLLGGSIVTNGIFTESQMLEAVGAAVTLIGFVWSWYAKKGQPVIEGNEDK